MRGEFVETCKCHACDGDVKVSFIMKPTEEDKLGWYCDKCKDNIEKEKSEE